MTLEGLKSKIAEVLEIEPSEIQDTSSPETIESWDPMGTLGIVSILDDALDGEVYTEEVASLNSFGAVLEFAR